MSLSERLARAERLFGGAPLKDALPPPVRAIIGPRIPEYEEAAQRALDKLRTGQRPEPREMAALELVVRAMRPAPRSRNGHLESLPRHRSNEDLHGPWSDFCSHVQPHLYSVARIDLVDGTQVATGFLVAEDVLATNRHVLDRLSYGTNVLEEGQAMVHFGQEWKTSPRPENAKPFPVLSCIAAHPRLDLALLRIEPQPDRKPLEVAAEPARIGDHVVALGYPMLDDERNPLFVQNLFAPAFGVKRAALGEVLRVGEDLVYHDCSTLGGNSGSPVLGLDKARVVGIHQSGFFMYQNEAVTAERLSAFVKASE